MILSTKVGRKRARVVALFAAVPFAAIGALGVATSAAASQPADGTHKVTYCHATHSEKNPYVIITTDKIAVVRAHERHQNDEDVIPAFTWSLAGKTGTFAGQGDDPDAFIANGCMGEDYQS